MGANLARLEARIAFEELLLRMPSYELEAEPRWYVSPLARALQEVPVRNAPLKRGPEGQVVVPFRAETGGSTGTG